MATLEGKRLLVLGGNSWADALREYTKRNGITMIAAGNNPNTALFRLADECYEVNSTDETAMIKLIKEKSIDGVYLGGNEPVINVACEYVKKCGLPCYCEKEQWSKFQNKKLFKSICIEAGLPVVPAYEISDRDINLPNELFPVITKPVDGCGSSGFSICNNNEELVEGYKRAADNSLTGKVIVEKLVNNQGNVVFYTVSEGRIYFSGLSDKYPVKFAKQGSFVGGLFAYESRYTEEFRSRFENNIQNLVDNVGIKEGTFWIEVFHQGDEYYFNEAGYRYGGSVSIYPVDYLFEINQMASDIYYALTGESKIYGHESLFGNIENKKKHYAIYPVYVMPGTIKEIIGTQKLEENDKILISLLAKSEGSVIADTGSFGQAAMLVHMAFDTFDELKDTISYIHRNLHIISGDNSEMVVQMLDLNEGNVIID